jgi:hypothetical protein
MLPQLPRLFDENEDDSDEKALYSTTTFFSQNFLFDYLSSL